ncbi:PaaI family thioesterase [Streptomyces sp. NBC_00289]|uniref:PaaI family thioesterase n=1 Tax=Streptomyces sp. NBC_00289 TaxID=2975703 RepID=UPI00352EF21A
MCQDFESAVHHSLCFGCGPSHGTGLGLNVVRDSPEQAHATFLVTVDHQGPPGFIHGGLLACLFDEVFAGAIKLMNIFAVTVRLETDFLAPIPIGSRIKIAAHCIKTAGRKMQCTGTVTLTSQNNQIAARASALFVSISAEQLGT